MVPPPFGDGNPLFNSERPAASSNGTAFNGATAFQRWKRRLAVNLYLLVSSGLPSMGPPPFSDGNFVDAAIADFYGRVPIPSMGPPPFSDGNTSGMSQSARRNRQMVNLQWGHRLSAMETRASGLRRHAFAAGRSFNGATAFRRWKLEDIRHMLKAGALYVASMGPPPFGDGNSVTSFSVDGPLGHAASMGPPPFGDGNWLRHVRIGDHHFPSMGPPPFGDGNTITCDAWDWSTQRRAASMVPPPFGDGNHTDTRLQLPPDVNFASMGQPPFGDGNVDYRVWSPEIQDASMGPPPFGDGNA